MKLFFLLFVLLVFVNLFSTDSSSIIEESSISLFSPKVEVQDPKEFIISYYNNLKKIPVNKSYCLLSTSFKERNGSYKDYLNYINSYEGIKVTEVTVLETNSDNHKTKLNTTVEYLNTGSTYKESYVLTLIYQDDLNSWVFY